MFEKNLKRLQDQSGQAVLLVLLGMAAVLTLVLSIVARSVVDISTVSRDEESSRAFSAAEEGVEALLLNPSQNYLKEVGDLTIDAKAADYGIGSDLVDFFEIESGESVTVWFVAHDETTGNLTCDDDSCFSGNGFELCWGASDATEDPAIELSVYYDDTTLGSGSPSLGASPNFSGVKVARKAFDPVLDRSVDNGFNYDEVDSGCDGGGNYRYSTDVGLNSLVPGGCTGAGGTGCLLFARIRSLYNRDQQGVAVTPSGRTTLPSQGKFITSVGSTSEATRKIETVQFYEAPLDVFDLVISSFGRDAGLTK